MKKIETIQAKPVSREVNILLFQLVMSSLVLFFAAGYAWPADDEAAFKAFLDRFRTVLKHPDPDLG